MKMRNLITLVLIIYFTTSINAQTIYSKKYGHTEDEPLIFLHGGPGYNSVFFEVSTAQKLADAGFYVIVYDRRGEGRSKDISAKFTFEESFADLNAIYDKFGIEKANLIGHSFGGILGTLYAEDNPEKVKSIILMSAPVSIQETFSTIIRTSKQIYKKNEDSINLKYIKMLENMDKTSLEYASYSFGHAMLNNFYTPKQPSDSARHIYDKLNRNKTYQEGKTMTTHPTHGFWKNESYTQINLINHLKNLKTNSIEIYGLYGQEDGLFSKNQIKSIEKLIPQQNFRYYKNCSHNVFIDQQKLFISTLKNWLQ